MKLKNCLIVIKKIDNIDKMKNIADNQNEKESDITIYGMLFNTFIIIPMLIYIIYFILLCFFQIDEDAISDNINAIIGNIMFLCPIIALFVIITGKIKYPHNNDINVKFWISIYIVIFCMIPFILLMKICSSCFN